MPYRNDLPIPSIPSSEPTDRRMIRPVGPTVTVPGVVGRDELRELYQIRELVSQNWNQLEAVCQQLAWQTMQINAWPLVAAGWKSEDIVAARALLGLYLRLRPFFAHRDQL